MVEKIKKFMDLVCWCVGLGYVGDGGGLWL